MSTCNSNNNNNHNQNHNNDFFREIVISDGLKKSLHHVAATTIDMTRAATAATAATALPPSSSSTTFGSAEDNAKALYCGEGLGPMVRASTLPLRSLAYKYGADFAYTEELIDRSIGHTQCIHNTQLGTIDYIKIDPHHHTRITTTRTRKVPKGHHDSLLILRIDPALERHRLVCQIGTGDAQHALQAAIHVHDHVAGIDINMGCPKKFSTGGGMGSALLQDPQRACDIIRTLSSTISSSSSILGSIDTGSCGSHDDNDNRNGDVTTTTTTTTTAGNQWKGQPIPVSAKIRLLSTVQGTVDFITGLVNAGVHAIAIHGRHVGNPDVEMAYWEELYTVLTIVIPKFPRVRFLINGDFYTRHEYTTFIQQTNAAGVLLSRPALYNTSIFIKPSTSPFPSQPSEQRQSGNTVIDSTTTPTTDRNDCTIPLTSQSVLYGYDSPLLLNKRTVVSEYLQEAVRYDGHYKNIKYVICEMLNLRRAPHGRVPYLNRTHAATSTTTTSASPDIELPTVGMTCAQNSIEKLCQLWNVNYNKYASNRTPSLLTVPLPDEHTYLDSYLLQQHNNDQRKPP